MLKEACNRFGFRKSHFVALVDLAISKKAVPLLFFFSLVNSCGVVEDFKEASELASFTSLGSTTLTKDDLYRPSIQEMSRSEAKSRFKDALIRYSEDYFRTDSTGWGEYIGAKEANDGRAVMFLWREGGRVAQFLGEERYHPLVVSFGGKHNKIIAAEDPEEDRVIVILKEFQLCVSYLGTVTEPTFIGDYWHISWVKASYDFGEAIWCTQENRTNMFALRDIGFEYTLDTALFFRSREEADTMISIMIAAFPNVSLG